MSLTYNTAVVLMGVSALGATAGVIGVFMVLRRRALAGDALAHASLPGLVASFLIFERRELPILLAGALASALLGIGVISLLRRYTRVKEDAAIGIVLSVFFGLGIVLTRVVQNRSTGASKAGLDSFLFGKTAGMIYADVVVIAGTAAAVMLIVAVLFKELKLVAFDPDFARSGGWPTLLLDLFVMALVAVIVMIGLPAVGVVLVAALLILPAAAARFWTESLDRMVLISAIIGAATGASGAMLSATFEGFPAGPVVILVGTLILIVSILAAPRRGVIRQRLIQRAYERRFERDALLRRVFHFSEQEDRWPGVDRILVSPRIRRAGEALLKSGLARQADGRFALTRSGEELAAELVRQERLWQIHLEESPEDAGLFADESDTPIEGILDSATVARLEQQLRRSGRWPTGRSEEAIHVAG